MRDESWMTIMKNGNKSVVAIVAMFDAFSKDRAERKHGTVLESEENVSRPFETVARLETRKIVIEFKAHGSAMRFREKFVGDDEDATCIAMISKAFIPDAKTMRRDVVAVGHVLVEFLGVTCGDKNGTIAKNDFVTGNVRFVKVLETCRRGGSNKKRNKFLDRDNDIRIHIIIVSFPHVIGK